MRTNTPVAIQRRDYQAPAWRIARTTLHFELHATRTRVSSELVLERQADGPLVLDGADLTLESIAVDGQPLPGSAWQIDGERMSISSLPDRCTLAIVTLINPEGNTALEGLYRSSGNFCTQCEAEGFRKITWYPDRPDVLSIFDVTIEADADTCPVLLSNGNLVSTDMLESGRHRVHWHDPHPKPCYLFALVAGDLAHIEDQFTTRSGRDVALFIYVESHNIDKCSYAMAALKRAMRWDEEVYGLEYDLERFMIVAVDDFNMGAMENKGLNIFNSKFVLADEHTATDTDFMGVESVVAHEYFHNWSGNRVTCRDWFQLSLKEGLTVFRDQEFTSDLHAREVKRIEDVRLLRAAQFPEDAGPLAHPIRPDSYIEINNFYTLTVYEKGAEVIRMLHTLLGPERYRQGVDLYFERFDGQAVTCDDFLAAMEEASGVDLQQFRRWYSTAGTPELTIDSHHDAAQRQLALTVGQHCPDTPGQTDKPPLHIPLRMGLLDKQGQSLPLSIGRVDGCSTVLDVTEETQTFIFSEIDEPPQLSLLRGFSAPVKLRQSVSNETLAFLMANDVDAFNRWDAGQQLAQHAIESLLELDDPAVGEVDAAFVAAMGSVLNDVTVPHALKAEALSLPGLSTLANAQPQINIPALHAARSRVRAAVAQAWQLPLTQLVEQGRTDGLAVLDARAMSERSLANAALDLLSALPPSEWLSLADHQYKHATNMTDRVAALGTLCHEPGPERDAALADFYERWQSHRLVIDKWFALQAQADHAGVLEEITALLEHPAFDVTNPNRLRSLIAVFASRNPVRFHRTDGRGYALLERFVVELDGLNPQIAAGLVSPLVRWQRHVSPFQDLMQDTLRRIAANDNLSPDVFEIVERSLSASPEKSSA